MASQSSQTGGVFVGYKPPQYPKNTKRDIDTYAVSTLEKNDNGVPVDFKGHPVNRRDPTTYITFARGDDRKSLGVLTVDSLREVIEPLMPPPPPLERTLVHERLHAIPTEKYNNAKKQIYIRGFVVQPGSKKIALTDTSGAVVLVNLPSLYHHGRFKVPQTRLYTPSLVAFTPNGKIMTMAQGNIVYLWDIAKKLLVRQVELAEPIHSLSLHPDGHRLACGLDASVVFLEFPSLTPVPGTEGTRAVPVSVAAPLRNLSYVPQRARGVLVGTQGNHMLLIDPVLPAIVPLEAHTDTIQCLAMHPKGTHVATGSKDKTIRLWNISVATATPTLVRVYKRHMAPIVQLAFSPDGNYLVSGSTDTTVRVWNLATGAKTEILKYTHRPGNTIQSVGFVVIQGTLMVASFGMLDKDITLTPVV